MIEEDVQEGEGVQEQEEIELRSPGDTEVSSPKSQTSQDMVRTVQVMDSFVTKRAHTEGPGSFSSLS